VSNSLEQLMSEASALAEQVRRARVDGGKQPAPAARVRELEERLSRTWTAIRMARASVGTVTDEMRRRPKWE
jgi:hypothetical protein